MYNIINQQIIPYRARSSGGRKAYYEQPGSSVVKFYSSSQVPLERLKEPAPVNNNGTEREGLVRKVAKALSPGTERDQTEIDIRKVGHGLNILV